MICYNCNSENVIEYRNFSGEEYMCLDCGIMFQINDEGKIFTL